MIDEPNEDIISQPSFASYRPYHLSRSYTFKFSISAMVYSLPKYFFEFHPTETADNQSLRLLSGRLFASLDGDGLVFLVDYSFRILATCSIIDHVPFVYIYRPPLKSARRSAHASCFA